MKHSVPSDFFQRSMRRPMRMQLRMKELKPSAQGIHPSRRMGCSARGRCLEVLSFCILVALGGLTCLAEDQEAASTLPLSPAESHAALRPAEGLEVDLILAEPVVQQPVSITFDERGRMWVVQYLQYPHPAGLKMLSRDGVWRARYDKVPLPPPHHDRGADKITIHEDTDGDGVLDKHSTFLDGLNIVTAVAHGRGGVWILNPPYLLYYADANRDDVPDGDPVVHLEGFGLEDTHSVVNSLCWGPDGWLYAAQGSTVSGDVRPSGSKAVPVHSMGQLVWRYHPTSRRYEVFSEGGGNAFGLEFDNQGRVYSGFNGGNMRGFHYMQGAYLQKGFTKHGELSNPYAFGYFPGMSHPDVTRFTHTFVIYDGISLPPKYRGALLGVAPMLHHVVTTEIRATGSTFATRDVGHVLTSDDPWFSPVDIKQGPDGNLYIADWYDRQLNHYDNHEGHIDKTNGRIYRLRARQASMAFRQEDLSRLSSVDLVHRLGHATRWQRQTARRLLADRHDASVIPLLRQRLAEEVGTLALESLWALNLVGGLDEPALAASLDHRDPHVRMWGVRLACDDRHVSPEMAQRLISLAQNESQLEVRAQLACSARRLSPNDSLPIVKRLANHLEDKDDARQPLLLWWAIETHCETAADVILTWFQKEPEVWRNPLVAEHIVPRLMRRFAATGRRRDWNLCGVLLERAPDEETQRRLITGFEQGVSGRAITQMPDNLMRALESMGGGSLEIRVRQGDPLAVTESVRMVEDPNVELERRRGLVKLFGEVRSPPALDVLQRVARQGADVTLQREAIASLANYDDARITEVASELYPLGTKELRFALHQLFVTRPAWSMHFLTAIDRGEVNVATLAEDTEVVLRMRQMDDPNLNTLLERHLGHVQRETAEALTQQITTAATTIRAGFGSPQEGRLLFEKTCAKCHRLFGQGGQVGPDLTSYQRDRLETMLLSVIHPSAEIREGYVTYQLEAADGRQLLGFLVDQDPQVVVLRNSEGQDISIARDQIESMSPQTISLMPEGLTRHLSDQQLRDLFAYLSSSQPLVER